MNAPKTLRTGKTALEVCQMADMSDEARAVLTDGMEPRAYMDALVARGKSLDAVQFLAHALPQREGVWWVWWCAKTMAGDHAPAEVTASLEATKKWIAEPTDENSHAAMGLADAAGLGTPAGCAGLAAFFSGTSMAPPNLDAVPPPEGVSAKAVAGGVTLAALTPDPREAEEKFKTFIQQGLEVTEKIKLWTPPEGTGGKSKE
jgi:Family of unknown function (DUF6931)